MEDSIKPQRAAKRKEPIKGATGKTKAVAVDEVAYSQVLAQAKKLKMSKSKYASAAIAYFAENGLDPTEKISEGLAGLNAAVLQETARGRTQAALIGNRIMSVIRTWEKNQYTFLQEQQAKSLNYLEQIENTLHRQHTAVETNLLTPMASMLIRAEIEQADIRYLSALTIMKAENYDEARKKLVLAEGLKVMAKEHVEKMREFMQTNYVAKPQPTPKPGVTPRPAVVSGADSVKTDKKQGIPLEAQVTNEDE